MIYNTNSGVLCGKVFDIHKFIEFSNPNRIYLDVDGVILHSCQAICDIINGLYETNIQGNEIYSWNFKELNSEFIDEDIEELFSNRRFFEIVKWTKGSFDFLSRYKEKVSIVTKGTNENIWFKNEMFNEFFNFNIPIIGLPLKCSKSNINMDGGLFIDDCTKNLIESNATYKIQFLEYKDHKNNIREWTKGWKGLKMYNW